MLDGISTCYTTVTSIHTFEELLACILLEECFMHHRARQVVNHKVENRLDLLFGVSSVVRDRSIL